MPAPSEKRGPRGRRSEIVSIRLDPRLKYLAELGARKQRRTLSGFIEWAVEQALGTINVKEDPNDHFRSVSLADADSTQGLWDVDEADRTIRLALNYPELLTYDEHLVWKLVRENGYLWRGSHSGPVGNWTWTPDAKSLRWDRLRAHWNTFQAVAAGERPASDLPKWQVKAPPSTPESARNAGAGSADADDIPF